MAHQDELDRDGIRNDGVSYYLADARQLQTYVDARTALSRFETPVFTHVDNPHECLFVASFDGTGNDKYKNPGHATNVAKIDSQLEALIDEANGQLGRGYVRGPGTQDELVARNLDAIQGSTYDARIEEMYKKFIEQAREWKLSDPSAEIRLAAIGFSRGGEEAAGFARLVHERGIQDPAGAHYTYDRHQQITHVEYALPPLAEPGRVPQAVALFDPVGTGLPEQHRDRRLPPSVISGIQITAMDERRGAFKSDHIIDPGLTPDGRFLGLEVAGAHSDVAGDYARNGLGIRAGNLAIGFLNGLSDRPFLKSEPEFPDPRMDVVHRSEEGSLFDRIYPKVDRASRYGYTELLVPWGTERTVGDPYNAEPRDELLNRQFERRLVDTDLQPAPIHVMRAAETDLSSRLDRMLAAARDDDWITFRRENGHLAYGAAGRALLEQADTQAGWLEQQALGQVARPHAWYQQAVAQQADPAMER